MSRRRRRAGPKVLLTGAAGFVGSHLARLLVEREYQVYAVVRPSSDTRRISDITQRLRILRFDLDDAAALKLHLKRVRPDVCIHAAWYAVPGRYHTAWENLDVLAASLRLLRGLEEVGCRRVVGIGTCFEYDTDQGYLSEKARLQPRTFYAAAKLALYHLLEKASQQWGLQGAWGRLFYLYGPYENENRLVPDLILGLLRGVPVRLTPGEQVRDFLHVEDVASALLAVVESRLCGAVNIGSGHPARVKDIALCVGETLGRPDLLRFGALEYSVGDPRFVCADNSRLLGETRWRPAYDLEAGLRHCVAWWRGQIGNDGRLSSRRAGARAS